MGAPAGSAERVLIQRGNSFYIIFYFQRVFRIYSVKILNNFFIHKSYNKILRYLIKILNYKVLMTFNYNFLKVY